MTTIKEYSKEYKLDAISLVLEQGYGRIEAARSLDINANSWVAGSRSIRIMKTYSPFEAMAS